MRVGDGHGCGGSWAAAWRHLCVHWAFVVAARLVCARAKSGKLSAARNAIIKKTDRRRTSVLIREIVSHSRKHKSLKCIFEVDAAATGFMRQLRKLRDERFGPFLFDRIGPGF